jgi:hypothetical protein
MHMDITEEDTEGMAGMGIGMCDYYAEDITGTVGAI